jgi:hypothetical protein
VNRSQADQAESPRRKTADALAIIDCNAVAPEFDRKLRDFFR